MSPKTVRNNISNIFVKLQLADGAVATCGRVMQGSAETGDPEQLLLNGTR